MRATRLTITNFRNLPSVSVPLTTGTVIVGENGVGKSNLVHALRLVLDPTLSSAQRSLRREDFWDGLSDGSPDWDPFVDGAAVEISVEIEDIDNDPAVLAALGLSVIDTDPLTARLVYRFEPRDDLEDEEGAAKAYDWGIYGGNGEERVSSDLRRFIAHVHLDALRDVDGDLGNWRRSPLRALIEQAADRVDPAELKKVGEALTVANDTLTELTPIKELSQTIAREAEQLAGPLQAPNTSLGLTPPEPLRILRALRLFVDGAARRPLSAASLGTLNVLYLALIELRLNQQLKDNEIAHAVISIEEPEAHLHPHTQRKVFSRLLRESSERTALVTTHSPHIVSVTPPRQLVVLRSTDAGVVAAAAAEADLNDAEWDDIERYIDTTRGELVFARRVLLVEGFAEQVLIPRIARDQGLDLDAHGISVCSIHGTHFDSYARFLTALEIRWAIITDGDPKKSDSAVSLGKVRAKRIATRLGESDADPTALGIFVGSVTFEQDLYEVDTTNAAACIVALSDLVSSVSADDDLAPDVFLAKVKNGKGRFAQRLASKDSKLSLPEYAESALKYLTA